MATPGLYIQPPIRMYYVQGIRRTHMKVSPESHNLSPFLNPLHMYYSTDVVFWGGERRLFIVNRLFVVSLFIARFCSVTWPLLSQVACLIGL